MAKEFKLETKNICSQLKFLANLEGLNMTLLKYAVNELFGKEDSIRNLYNKMKHNRLRVSELAEIAEVLNYEIILRKKP
ncbi:uncharacterized protein BN819_01257 [Clostridium sp. CAG:967]|nr:uncharacterized protein BN819_01257 [Clostridium sp. CAG:967]